MVPWLQPRRGRGCLMRKAPSFLISLATTARPTPAPPTPPPRKLSNAYACCAPPARPFGVRELAPAFTPGRVLPWQRRVAPLRRRILQNRRQSPQPCRVRRTLRQVRVLFERRCHSAQFRRLTLIHVRTLCGID